MMIEREGGFAVVWVAVVLVFLLGSAALAVDASEFWQQARQQQTAADLGCLAGVRYAPTNRTQAVELAASFTRPNHRGLNGMDVATYSTSGTVSSWNHGDFTVEVETPVNGDRTVMRVSILQSDRPTRFGRVIGSNAVTIVQQAYCQVGSPLNLGDIPLALDVVAGESCEDSGVGCVVKFPGGPECNVENGPGNCGSIDIPRHDDPPGSTASISGEYELNLALGANWDVVAGNPNTCRTGVGATAEPCGWFKTVTGNKPPQLTRGLITGPGAGFEGRLDRDPPHASNVHPTGVTWDGHFLDHVASCDSSGGLGASCGGDTTVKANVYKVYDCTDPRWGAIPIIQDFGTGSTPVQYLRSEFAWIQEPDGAPEPDPVHPSTVELSGSGQVQIAAIRILGFPLGADTPVENVGECQFYQFEEGAPTIVRLIAAP